MVNWLGQWTEEKDYNTYPKGQWCDFDYVADYIRNNGYEPETDIENLITMIILHYEGELENEDIKYFGIEDQREYPDNLMINIDDVSAYIEATGGIKEFDYYA